MEGKNDDKQATKGQQKVTEKDPDQGNEMRLASKIMKTIFLVLVWVTLGLCGEITGPTLLDLKLKTHSNFEDVSSGLSGRGVGFFVGSLLGGGLVDKFSRYCDSILAASVDGNAVTTLAITWMPNTDWLFVMTLLQGTMEGVMNVAGQKLILDIWKERAAGPLHLLHGGYGVGSFLIPLIANPFLAVTTSLTDNATTDGNFSTSFPPVTMTTRTPTTTEIVTKESRMEWAYVITAAITVLVSLIFYGYQFTGGKSSSGNRSSTDGEQKETRKALSFKEMINPATCAGGRMFYGAQVVVCVILFYIHAEGGEVTNGKFVRAYAVKHLDFSEDDGSYINTVFWAAFTAGRFGGLLTARFIPIRILIMLETGSVLIMAICLALFGDDAKMFWILSPIMGFCIGPIYPSGIAWANYHIEVTGVALTFFMLGGSLGNFGYIRLVGYLLDRFGFNSFLYTLLGFGIALFVTTTLMNLIGCQHGNRFASEKEQRDVDVDESTGNGRDIFDNKGFEIHYEKDKD